MHWRYCSLALNHGYYVLELYLPYVILTLISAGYQSHPMRSLWVSSPELQCGHLACPAQWMKYRNPSVGSWSNLVIDCYTASANWQGCQWGMRHGLGSVLVSDILWDLVKIQGWKIYVSNYLINLKFDRQLSSNAAKAPVKFQINAIIQTTNLVVLRPHDILRYLIDRLLKQCPCRHVCN